MVEKVNGKRVTAWDVAVQILITNLVSNGSFESSYTNWTSNSQTINTSYHKYGSNSSSRPAFADEVKYVYQDISFIGGHKYYYFLYAATAQSIQSDVNSRSGSAFAFSVSSSDGWKKGGHIYTSSAIETRSISVNYAETSAVTYVDGVGIVDLTAAFGAGNEPNLGWCNEYIDYFDGSMVLDTIQ